MMQSNDRWIVQVLLAENWFALRYITRHEQGAQWTSVRPCAIWSATNGTLEEALTRARYAQLEQASIFGRDYPVDIRVRNTVTSENIPITAL